MEVKNNQLAPIQKVKSMLSKEDVQKRFKEILGKRAPAFMSSIINLVNSNTDLQQCEPRSILASAAVAATLDLPIDPNLGLAYIVPYKVKGVSKAQFQIGYKGFVQLALRTGQYRRINVIEIKGGQLKSFNPLTEEIEFDFNAKESDKVIGYAAYFQLINGFEKVVYWPIEKVIAHGQRYSKTFNNGPWKTNFDEMAKKTVLKNTLSKWGILSIEMQTAIKADQAVINRVNKEEIECEYVDNPNYEINYEVKDAENEEIKNIEEEISFEGTPFEENNEELEGQ